MIGRVVRAADFERALRTAPRARSVHFSLHHVGHERKVTAHLPSKPKLSTGEVRYEDLPVDELFPAGSARGEQGPLAVLCLGLVVPKRHARRSVSRSLLKRQMRDTARRHVDALDAGVWVLRLKAGFETTPRGSAASEALRVASRTELDGLFASLRARARRSGAV